MFKWINHYNIEFLHSTITYKSLNDTCIRYIVRILSFRAGNSLKSQFHKHVGTRSSIPQIYIFSVLQNQHYNSCKNGCDFIVRQSCFWLMNSYLHGEISLSPDNTDVVPLGVVQGSLGGEQFTLTSTQVDVQLQFTLFQTNLKKCRYIMIMFHDFTSRYSIKL